MPFFGHFQRHTHCSLFQPLWIIIDFVCLCFLHAKNKFVKYETSHFENSEFVICFIIKIEMKSEFI